MTMDFIARLLAVDQTFQGMVLIINSLATLITLRLVLEAWRDYRSIRGNGDTEARKLIAKQGLKTQAALATVQIGFWAITVAVMTLPEIPVYTMGHDITLVIGFRKLVRALMIMVLAYHSWTSHLTRVKVLALLKQH